MPTPDAQVAAPRVPRHLIDLDNPRPVRRREPMSLSQVQRWVMSTLATTTILHFSAGLVLAAIFVDDTRMDARIGLNIIAGVVGVVAVAAAMLIHQRSLLTPWLVLGLAPTAIGFWLTFR